MWRCGTNRSREVIKHLHDAKGRLQTSFDLANIENLEIMNARFCIPAD